MRFNGEEITDEQKEPGKLRFVKQVTRRPDDDPKKAEFIERILALYEEDSTDEGLRSNCR